MGKINIIITASCSSSYISDYEYAAQGFLAFDTTPPLFFFLTGMLFILSYEDSINTVKIILKGGKIGFKDQPHSSIH